MDDTILENILTIEEKQQLEAIQKKIQNNLDDIYKKNIEQYKKNNEEPIPNELDEASHPTHVTTYQREILVSLRAEMSTVDEKGNLKDVQQCIDNFYHIPVPPGVDHEQLLKEFVDKFDQELTSCAKKIHLEKDVATEQ